MEKKGELERRMKEVESRDRGGGARERLEERNRKMRVRRREDFYLGK